MIWPYFNQIFTGGGTANIAVSDSGAGSDAPSQLLASLALADSGAGLDAAAHSTGGVPTAEMIFRGRSRIGRFAGRKEQAFADGASLRFTGRPDSTFTGNKTARFDA